MLKSFFLLAALAIVAHGVPPRFKVTVAEMEKPDDELNCATFEGMTLSQNLCDPHFWQCTNGKLVKKICPEGLKYDIENHHCNNPEKMNGCKKCEKISEKLVTTNMNAVLEQILATEHSVEVPASNKDSAAEGHAALDYNPEEELIFTVEVDPTEIGIDCATLGEATISKIVCGPYFWQCANGKLFRKTCPEGLMFDAEKNYCEYPEGVEGCEGIKKVSPKPSTPSSTDEKKKKNFECQNKEDGFYDMGICLKTFASCREGKSRIIECDSGLVYDARIYSCDYPDACKSDREHVAVAKLLNHAGQNKDEVKTVESELDCGIDGMTISEHLCEPDVWQCTNGKLLKKTCPKGLVFDNEHHWCNYPEKVEGCKKVNG